MSNENVVIGVVTGVIVGVASSIVAQRALRARDALLREEELSSATSNAFDEGWHRALSDKGQVRAAYQALFGADERTEIRSHRRG